MNFNLYSVEIFLVPVRLFKMFLVENIIIPQGDEGMDKQTLMRTIGNNIRNHQKLRGLTQEQLAEKAGISTSFCANIERGNKGISLFVLKDISDILEVSVDRLMSAEDDYDYMQDIAALLNGRPKEFIIAVEQIVRICVKEFAKSGSGQGGTE